MPSQDLHYRLTADSSKMERGFKSAEESAKVFERELARLEAQQRRVDSAMERLGRGFVAGGAAIATGLALSVKAAIDWESAWTGVAKVVSGTPAQLAALEEQLRGLTLILPQSGQEIAAVAAEAGALGIARQDIANFTKIMVEMGTATNLTSEEAADALARLMNIMKTAPSDVERLASAIVALGNDGASTESEITAMALRIAGAGNIIGLSESDVLGFASALASVGIEAEAGGSAISTIFVKIDAAVRSGGEQLERFAAVAGMSADQFRQAYQQDAARAISTFVEGLGGIARSGGDVFKILAGLEVTEIRQRDALLRLAGAGDLLTQSLRTGAQAWQDNTALAAEAERRFQTVEARMQIARNAVVNLGISLGQVLLPVVGKAADVATGLLSVMADLPEPVRITAVVVAGLASALALAGGAALIAIPKIAAFKGALDTLAAAEGRAAAGAVLAGRAIGGVTSFLAGPWGLAIAAAITAVGFFAVRQAEAKRRVDELADTLDKQTGAITEATRATVFKTLQDKGLADAAQRLGINLADLTDAALGQSAALERVNSVLREAGAMSGITSEQYEALSDEQRRNMVDAVRLRDALADQSSEIAHARDRAEQQREALQGTDDATKRLDPSTRRLGEALGVSADKAEEAADRVKQLGQELDALFETLFGVEEAEDDVQKAIDRVLETVDRAIKAHDKHARSLDGNSKAALENRDNVRALIKAYFDQIQALAESGASSEELRRKTEELRNDFVKQMRQAGFSETAIRKYAAAFDQIPAAVSTTVNAYTQTASNRLAYLHGQIKNMPSKKTIDVVVHLTGETNISRIAAQLQKGRRWGGIDVAMAAGGALLPGIYPATDPPLVHFAEPGTGGEAYIPRFGDRDRSLQVWRYVGENWLGMNPAVLDAAQAGARHPVVAAPVISSTRAAASGPIMIENHIEIGGEVVRVVRTEISEHDRGMRRRVLAGSRR